MIYLNHSLWTEISLVLRVIGRGRGGGGGKLLLLLGASFLGKELDFVFLDPCCKFINSCWNQVSQKQVLLGARQVAEMNKGD